MTELLIILATFLAMEFVAWFTHKYIMHGFLWVLHKDHHQKTPGFIEKNDSFFLIFALPSIYFYISGIINHDIRLFIGIGISVYGFAYFLVHEVIIHQRIKWLSRLNGRYIRAIRRAHKIHHKHLNKFPGENFGMLIVPVKYWKETNKLK